MMHGRQRVITTLIIGAAMVLTGRTASALPLLLTQAEFATATAGLATVTEDFEGFATGNKTNPFTFANGTMNVAGSSSQVISTVSFGKALAANSLDTARTISALPGGTTLWGATLFGGGDAEVFQVTVVGNSGTSVFQMHRGVFGVSDDSGLISVSVLDLGDGFGRGLWFLDNIVTASPAPTVPEPGTLSLLALGLAATVARRRSRRYGDHDTRR